MEGVVACRTNRRCGHLLSPGEKPRSLFSPLNLGRLWPLSGPGLERGLRASDCDEEWMAPTAPDGAKPFLHCRALCHVSFFGYNKVVTSYNKEGNIIQP